MLSTYRESAATALTVKTGNSLAEKIHGDFMALNVEDIGKASWGVMMSYQQQLSGLSTINDVLRQLANAKDIAGAEMQHQRLAGSKQEFLKWMDNKLCPTFPDALKEICEYCENAFTLGEGASFTDIVGACPTDSFPVPKTALMTNQFVFS